MAQLRGQTRGGSVGCQRASLWPCETAPLCSAVEIASTRLWPCCCVSLQVIDASGGVSWEDIAGLETAKNLIKEIVVWPMMNPELFTVRCTRSLMLLMLLQAYEEKKRHSGQATVQHTKYDRSLPHNPTFEAH